ncbi:MAG: methylmalonyl-CoA mutase [Gemmatimonadetes bacterium]|nr:methylmalonyl-CoA mutase [Gemmatimonadota bacterium]MYG85277.1 methylmalonyl-CoA mutase [Gemmatimonadota bacterium]MYJ88944.1 methylmalonyl-CoA mutase [Gemmatimonadota bacterium]
MDGIKRKPKEVESGGRPLRKPSFTNISGSPVEGLYTAGRQSGAGYLRDEGYPGQYPYTRGIHASLYRGRPWTIRQFSGFGSAADSNARFKFLLEQGQNGLSVAFDVPTLMGLDSDHPSSEGEVGVCGVAVDTLEDMETLFTGIPLDRISTSMTINAPAAVLLAMYLALAEKRGISWTGLRGTLQNDILKEYIAQKEWICPPASAVGFVSDTVVFCTERVPRWNPVSISGYHIREAGATAAQELAFTLADGFAYVDACMASGLDVDRFASRLSFFFNAHIDFFEEIAKFRAARRIWARHMRRRYGARSERSWMLRFHTQTAGCSLTAQQPENNIVRTAVEALSAVLGGTQSLHTNALDEAYALPSEKAARIAVRTQQIIAHETGVTDTVDPLGGSYYVESLTNRLEEEAEAYFKKIDGFGGMVGAIESGFPQREIMAAANRYQAEIEDRERIITGVNDFVAPENRDLETLRIDPRIEREQRSRLDAVRRRRDGSAARHALDDLGTALRNGENIMPPMLDAVKAYATLGEIVGVMQEVHGLYEEPAAY